MRLAIDRVGKRYGRDFWAMRDFSLELGPGVTGLLGPNGAGKSTLMRILATVARPTEGRVTWNDVDTLRHPADLRAVLGYLPQEFGVYPELTAREFLHYLAAVKRLDRRLARRRIEELLELVNLTQAARRPLRGFSGGMRQRLGIAQALLNDPQLLIVDEPTVGLDPEERVRFRNLLADLAGERVVILSTHIVSDVEATATRVALIDHGRLIAHCTTEELIREAEGKVWELALPSQAFAELRASHTVSAAARRGDGVLVRLVSEDQPVGLGPLLGEGEPVPPSLEDAYLYHLRTRMAPGGERR